MILLWKLAKPSNLLPVVHLVLVLDLENKVRKMTEHRIYVDNEVQNPICQSCDFWPRHFGHTV